MLNSSKPRRLTIRENLAALPHAFRCGVTCDRSELRAALSFPVRDFAVIGSGASFSAALLIARWLNSAYGVSAHAYTPYEYYLADKVPSGAILISARGKNPDILAVLHVCILRQVKPLLILTAVDNSPLLSFIAGYPSSFRVITGCLLQYEKEGFFGVQTLIAAIGAIAGHGGGPNRAFAPFPGNWAEKVCAEAKIFLTESNSTLLQVAQAEQVVVLGAGWAWPAVVDFESKWIEGGLGWIEACESKNYTHGRYMNAHPKRTVFILFATSDNLDFLEVILTAYAGQFSVLTLVSKRPSFEGACELLIRGCHIFAELSQMKNIDVSNPIVPDYGRILFTAPSLYPELEVMNTLEPYVDACISLKRQSYEQEIGNADGFSQRVVRPVVLASLAELWCTRFGALAADVDGTLLELGYQDEVLPVTVAKQLNRLLKGGVGIAIVSGRGRSILEILCNSIDRMYWHAVRCYLRNGAVLVNLGEKEPVRVRSLCNSNEIMNMIKGLRSVMESSATVRIDGFGAQITIDMGQNFQALKAVAFDIRNAVSEHQFNVQVRDSGRCVDVFSSDVGKDIACNHYLQSFVEPLANGRLLIIGDSGHLGGNDHEMLQLPYSISVGTIHWSANTCFPILAHDMSEISGSAATASVLRSATIGEGWFKLSYDAYQRNSK